MIVRCTKDTNITLDKGKQRYKVIEIGLRPTKADAPIKKKIKSQEDKEYV